jgi:alpha-galactosidase
LPTRVLVQHDGTNFQTTNRQGSRFTSERAVVNLAATVAGQEVRVTCPRGPLSRVVLRWEMIFPGDTLFLGDHWERSYGDLQWRFLQPERILP